MFSEPLSEMQKKIMNARIPMSELPKMCGEIMSLMNADKETITVELRRADILTIHMAVSMLKANHIYADDLKAADVLDRLDTPFAFSTKFLHQLADKKIKEYEARAQI